MPLSPAWDSEINSILPLLRLKIGKKVFFFFFNKLRKFIWLTWNHLGPSECSSSFTKFLLQLSSHQNLQFSQLTWHLGLQLSYTPQAEQSLFLHSHDLPWSLALSLSEAPSSSISFTCALPCSRAHHRHGNVPSGAHSWCFLSWSPPHLISH